MKAKSADFLMASVAAHEDAEYYVPSSQIPVQV
jgi:hypothetical protein